MTTQTLAKEKPLIPSHVRRSNTSEQFLEDIAEAIQIPEGRYEEAVNRYKSLKKWLTRNESTLKDYNPEVSLQGSFKLGTVIKPICEEEEYDIDLVCTTALTKSRVSQKRLKAMLGVEIHGYAKAHGMQDPESKRRCWRVQYAQDAQFHLDALPAIPEAELPRLLLEIRGVGKELVGSSLGPFLLRRIGQRHFSEGIVHQDRNQKQYPDDQAGPVAIKIGVVDALVHHSKGDGAKEDADHRAKAAGQ